MLNTIMKLKNSEVANVTDLFLKKQGDKSEVSAIVYETSDRFVMSAYLLPENDFLGCQISTAPNGNHQVFAFTDEGVSMSSKDFNWIFHEIASSQSTDSYYLEDMFLHGRSLYALKYNPRDIENNEENNRNKPDFDNYWKRKYFGDLFEAFKDNEAVITLMANSKCGGSGTVLISLPGEMSLRMQTMLSMVFSDVTATEISVSEDGLNDIGCIPLWLIDSVFSELMRMLMLDKCSKAIEGESEDDFEPDFEAEEDFTSIDKLDLSVRAFNCLMRAGIRSVEELCTMSDEDFHKVRNLGRKCTEEIKSKLAQTGYISAPIQEPQPKYSEMLEELIGLENVKEQVKRITALAKMKQDMAQQGKKSIPIVLNMEFVGNPGTAKTTVARIIAGIFYEIGLLSSNEIVEVGRADLVGKYVGHTADKVKSVFSQAKGKLLFIDEAYSLVERNSGQFGDEAINTIVQEMENKRSETIVVFAGYPDKMKDFFLKNPGLRSRVPFHVSFSDYSIDEMVQIAELEAKRRGFSINQDTKEKVTTICASAVKNPEMGNGRFCRNLVESAILDYASRVYGNDDSTESKDFVLTDADFTVPEILRERKKTAPIGFVA